MDFSSHLNLICAACAGPGTDVGLNTLQIYALRKNSDFSEKLTPSTLQSIS